MWPRHIPRLSSSCSNAPLDLPAALALLAFYIYALLCTSTLAVMRRETGTWRWPLFALAYTLTAAWLAGWVTHGLAALILGA